ncbi:MAG TPA: YeeE/YedE thiosulfate transporter family protein [Aliidongia sp.]|uniref:YeeE/YedE thiosulfate transporter family protein n=1 Tax=Aliidongia sp. TaxID=1914230 RepID=UPI002DDD3C4D|nr:YeeE/YedE thiosulfate transporter family protein [Aliidongia sp.]HEV2673011.1 YeeE/YedE thiosulfate transporter family protein [Aliidongia sp.]
MATLIFSIICAATFGYASQRGGFCVTSAVTAVMENRSGRLFLSFLRCSLWAALSITLMFWVGAGAVPMASYPPTFWSVAGGVLFGAGAAINGGCTFGTLNRLAAGNLSFLVSILGMLFGAWASHELPIPGIIPLASGTSILVEPSRESVLLLALISVGCLRELALIWRKSGRERGTPEQAAVVLGVCGGLLYALDETWAYPLNLDRLAEALKSAQARDIALCAVSVAALAGAAICAWQDGKFQLRLPWRPIPRRLFGGVAMGIGTTLIPGGNGTLLLQWLPALSPHAPIAYAALVFGAAASLGCFRSLRKP